jgi:hypothetical protein
MNGEPPSRARRPLGRLLRRFDDWLNPIAVKELRQAMQARLIAGLLLLFLIGLLVTTMALASERDRYGGGTGYEGTGGRVFIVLYGILVGTCVGLVPLYCGGRLMTERSGAHSDLLFATALRPRSIVWGKFSSGLILIVLIYSACAPFLTLTYLLRGIDLSVIFLLLGIGFLLSALSLACTIFLACVPTSNLLRGLLGLVWLGVTLYVLLYFMRLARLYMEYGGGFPRGEFWAVIAVVAAFVLIPTGFLFVASLSLMSPPSANRILPVRVYVTIAWLVTGLVVFFALGPSYLMLTWATLCVFLFCCGLLVAVSERDRIGPRIARTVPRSWLRRPLAFLFYTGSAGGVVWSCLMIGLTLFALNTYEGALSSGYPLTMRDMRTLGLLGMAAYAFAYAMTGYVLQRSFLSRAGTGQTWMLALCVAALAFLPLLAGHLFQVDPFLDRRGSPLWMIGTPLLVFDRDYHGLATSFAGVWAAVVFVLALPRLWRQVVGFRPLKKAPYAAPQAAPAPSVVETPAETAANSS